MNIPNNKVVKKTNLQCISFIFGLLFLPIIYISYLDENVFSLNQAIIGTLGISLLILTSYLLLNRLSSFLAKLIALGSLIIFFLVRLILSFVYDFSGRGFTSEFFAHFEWKSFEVGFDEYGYVLLLIITFFVGFIYLIGKLLNTDNFFSLRANLILFFLSIGILFFSANAVPELLLLKAYSRYSSTRIETGDIVASRSKYSQILQPLRQSDNLPIEKNKISATSPANPKNIIIIYLESFSEILTNNNDYPNLTPNLDFLKDENVNFENNFSSAYVTIEGIANSQCGTLMNMDSENNSLTNESGRLPNLPCLGDVLHEAGYKQVFYGGADLAFAGKGAFFKEHGYDDIKGILDWKKAGFETENTWGLSDTELFNQALLEVVELKKESEPFNLTLLTLGTHLPGFKYKECPDYIDPNNPSLHDSFLDAIHCTDYLVGKFINELKQHEILQDTIVYIQGDHAIFPTHDMKRLFGEEALYRTILSIIVTPEKIKLNTEKPSSTVNMAANILDLLDIEHNVDFILGQSDFAEDPKNPYTLTRYDDYFGLEKIYNIPDSSQCRDNETDHQITFPLDNCEKGRVLNAVYGLDATYAYKESINEELCQLGVETTINSTSGKVDILWGNENLSERFFYKGRVFTDFKKGLYAVFLDSHDHVISQQFYSPQVKNDIRDFKKKILNQNKNSKILLLTNLSTEEILGIDSITFPDDFVQKKIIYAKTREDSFVNLSDSSQIPNYLLFFPESCGQNSNIFAQAKTESAEVVRFCEILDWGPQKIIFEDKFNEQPNGKSAFWLKTDCIPENTVYRLDGQILNTVIRLPLITSEIDEELYLKKPGEYTLDLYHKESRKSFKVGTFTVLPSENKPFSVSQK